MSYTFFSSFLLFSSPLFLFLFSRLPSDVSLSDLRTVRVRTYSYRIVVRTSRYQVVCTAYVLGSWFDLVSIRPKLIRTGSSDSIPARETLASVDVYTMT
jgi:hypothetical protein